MREHHGVAHSSALRDAGFSEQTVRRAVSSGRLLRIRRSWLISADCSTDRRAAATAGGRVPCVSAAKELGLWVPATGNVHVAVASPASRVRSPGLDVHWAHTPLPLPPPNPKSP